MCVYVYVCNVGRAHTIQLLFYLNNNEDKKWREYKSKQDDY